MKYLIILILVFSCNIAFGDRVLKSDVNKLAIEDLVIKIDQLKKRIEELEKPHGVMEPISYYCNNCGQRWLLSSDSIGTVCCVNHSLGDCRHMGEELEDRLEETRDAVNKNIDFLTRVKKAFSLDEG